MSRGSFIVLGWLILSWSCGAALAQSSGAQGACDASKDLGCIAKDVNKSLNDAFQPSKLIPVPQPKVAGVAMKQVLVAGNEPATQIYSEALPSALFVVAHQGNLESLGSAVAISDDVAMTNCHVVIPEIAAKKGRIENIHFNSIEMAVLMKDGQHGTATLVEHHEGVDLCFIRVSGLKLSPIKAMRPYGWLKVGEPVYALGNPQGMTFTFTQGVISQLRPELAYPTGETLEAIQFSAAVDEGSSGGPLLDGSANLIGITSLGVEQQGFNFAIAADLAWRRYGK